MNADERAAWATLHRRLDDMISRGALDGYVPLMIVMTRVGQPWQAGEVDLDINPSTIGLVRVRAIPNALAGNILDAAAERAREIG